MHPVYPLLAVILVCVMFYNNCNDDRGMKFIDPLPRNTESTESLESGIFEEKPTVGKKRKSETFGEEVLDELSSMFSKEQYDEVISQTESLTEEQIGLLSNDLQMKYYYIRGMSLYKSFQFKAGVDHISKCLSYTGRDESSRVFRGLCHQGRSEIYFNLGEHERSLHDADMAMENNVMNLNDFNARVLYLRGINQIKMGQYSQGVKALQLSGNLFPKIEGERFFHESLAKGKEELKKRGVFDTDML